MFDASDCSSPSSPVGILAGRRSLLIRVSYAVCACAVAVASTGLTTRPGSASAAPMLSCFKQEATIVGTPGTDILTGTEEADVIVTLGGDDVISGLGGEDRICAGAGDDRVNGGFRDDRIEGGVGNDRLDGGEYHDVLLGGDGDDRIVGDSGVQVRAMSDYISGGHGNDTVDGGQGSDTLRGEEGEDKLRGGSNGDKLLGGPGDDELDYAATRPTDRRQRNILLRSLKGHDTLVGDSGNDRLGVRFARAGDDELDGSEGKDILRGLPPDQCDGGGDAGDSVKGRRRAQAAAGSARRRVSRSLKSSGSRRGRELLAPA